MASMTINQTVERSVLVMVHHEQERIVKVLAEKYGFDQFQAITHLREAGVVAVEKKEVVPRKPKEPKAKKGKAKDSDEPKPKKAKTGYLLFCDAARESARAKLEREADEKSKAGAQYDKVMPKHVVTLLAGAWKDLDEGEKAMWKDRAEAIKEGRGDDLEDLVVELEEDDDDLGELELVSGEED